MHKLIRDWKNEKLDPRNDVLARWLLLLGIVDHRKETVYEDIYRELEEVAMKDKQLFDAFQHWEELRLSDAEYFAYLNRFKRIKDEEAVIIEAKLREEKALIEGHEKGRQEGIEQGIKQGREEGIRQMILNLIENEFSDEMIAKITKQPIEKVQAIRESM